MVKKFNPVFSWFFLILLVFSITPKELFHSFHHHYDEVEHIDLNCHGTHFEKKHQHCPTLDIVTQSFVSGSQEAGCYFIKCNEDYKINFKLFLKIPIHFLFGLKAPPALLHLL